LANPPKVAVEGCVGATENEVKVGLLAVEGAPNGLDKELNVEDDGIPDVDCCTKLNTLAVVVDCPVTVEVAVEPKKLEPVLAGCPKANGLACVFIAYSSKY
jgi:hypothetical protein